MLDNSDEELYEALTLEERLSAGDPSALTDLQKRSFPYELSTITLISGRRERKFIALRGRMHRADPLHPTTLIMLALWLPVNIVYLSFQVLRDNLATRVVARQLHSGTARMLPSGLEFIPEGIRETLPYHEISRLGYYSNGVRINYSHGPRTDRALKKLVIRSPAAPTLFVGLTHLAATASIESGLNVPNDFLARCQAAGRPLHPSRMHRNPPTSWKAAADNFRLPIPVRRIVAAFIIVVIALAILPLLFSN